MTTRETLLPTHVVGIDYAGRRRAKGPQGELAFGVSRSVTSHHAGTPQQRKAAYEDWAARLREAKRAAPWAF